MVQAINSLIRGRTIKKHPHLRVLFYLVEKKAYEKEDPHPQDRVAFGLVI